MKCRDPFSDKLGLLLISVTTPWIVTKSDSAGGSDDNATMTVIMVAIAMSNRGKVRSLMVLWLYADSADLFLFLTIHSF